jgi:hypothetical protein
MYHNSQGKNAKEFYSLLLSLVNHMDINEEIVEKWLQLKRNQFTIFLITFSDYDIEFEKQN